jgi:hypothetical protein
MIDRKSISLRWVLRFSRAKTVYDSLRLNTALVTTCSIEELRIIFKRHVGKYEVLSNTECSGDIQLIHRQFQFQRAMVEGSWAQKIEQFIKREVIFRGMPDELTLGVDMEWLRIFIYMPKVRLTLQIRLVSLCNI